MRLVQQMSKRLDRSIGALSLLGDRASQRSGVPLRGDLIERAAKQAYCHAAGYVPSDPRVRRSDWLRWLHNQFWYNAHQALEDQYVTAIGHLLPPEERRTFFHELSYPRIPPSSGYTHLLQLMAAHRICTVLTVNFDMVLPKLATTVTNPRRLTVIRSPDDYRRLSTAPLYPQLVFLYGDAERYADSYFTGAMNVLTTS
jgi:hypothetical protein